MGFTVLALAMSAVLFWVIWHFARMRSSDTRALNQFHQMDLVVLTREYVSPAPISRLHSRLMDYCAIQPEHSLKALSSFEFVYQEEQEDRPAPQTNDASSEPTWLTLVQTSCQSFFARFFTPYYRLSLDECREGAMVFVSGKVRGETLMAVGALAMLIFLLAGVKLGVAVLLGGWIAILSGMAFAAMKQPTHSDLQQLLAGLEVSPLDHERSDDCARPSKYSGSSSSLPYRGSNRWPHRGSH
jgi:hypothetical protein